MRLITLFFLYTFAVVGGVLYTPALPSLVMELGMSKGDSQLTVSLFLLAYAIGQLPYGPLGNALGRKRSVYIGCMFAVVGSLISACADGFPLFATGRVIAGLGMASGLVTAFTLVGDLYDQQGAHRVVSMLTLSIGIIPGLAIALGGLLTEHLGWRSCFYFLAFYSLIVAALTSRLPATGPKPDLHTLDRSHIVAGWWRQLRSLPILLGGTFIGLATMLTYLYAAEAPFIAITKIRIHAGTFGLFNLLVYGGFVVGGLLSARLAPLAPHRILSMGLSVILLSTLTMTLLFAMGIVNLWTLFLPTGLLFTAVPLAFSPVVALATSQADDKANASAVMTFLQILWATAGTSVLSLAMPEVPLSMPILLSTAALLMVPVYWRLKTASATH